MNEKFFDLKKEKQDRIINGSLKVFSKYGYVHASTDEMIREAGISKGLLFHYFGSKEGLYTFLLDYSARYAIMELSTGVKKDMMDYFDLHKQILEAETRIIYYYPYMLLFLNSAESEILTEILTPISLANNQLKSCYQNLLGRANPVFPAPIDCARMTQMIHYTLFARLKDHLMQDDLRIDAFEKEMNAYIDLLARIK